MLVGLVRALDPPYGFRTAKLVHGLVVGHLFWVAGALWW